MGQRDFRDMGRMKRWHNFPQSDDACPRSTEPDPHSENPLSPEPYFYGLSPYAATPSPISQDASADKHPQIVAALSVLTSKEPLHVPASAADGEAAKIKSQSDERLGEAERYDRAANERSENAMKAKTQKAEKEEAHRIKAGKRAARQAAIEAERCRRKLEKIEEKQRKTDNKKAKAEKKARRVYLGGVSWGFDPTAGRRRCGSSAEVDNSSYHDRLSRTWSGAKSIGDRNTRRRWTGHRWEDRSVWGIEHGEPGSSYAGSASHASAAQRQPSETAK